MTVLHATDRGQHNSLADESYCIERLVSSRPWLKYHRTSVDRTKEESFSGSQRNPHNLEELWKINH